MHRSQDLSTKISQEPHPVRGVPERETGAKMSYCHHASLCASIVTFDKEDQSEVACRIEEARTGRGRTSHGICQRIARRAALKMAEPLWAFPSKNRHTRSAFADCPGPRRLLASSIRRQSCCRYISAVPGKGDSPWLLSRLLTR